LDLGFIFGDSGDAGADPADYRDGEGVAGALILRAVGGLALGLALPGDVRPVVWEALESEAFVGGKAADRHRLRDVRGQRPLGLAEGDGNGMVIAPGKSRARVSWLAYS
jgi:hypothetical protein